MQPAPAPVVQNREVVVINQVPVQNQASVKQLECPSLELEIQQIDALARQALSGQAQDNLAERRKQVRSRQFALHC